MDIVIDVSVAVIAAAFLILVIYLICLMLTLRKTLFQVDQTLLEVRKQFGSLDPMFHTVANVGEFLERKTASLKEESQSMARHRECEEAIRSLLASSYEREEDLLIKSQFADILEWASLTIRLWQKLTKRR